jgi:hypothetical protein
VSIEVQLRPTGTIATAATSNVGGAATFHAALSDNSNTTYALPTGGGNMQLYDVGTYTLAANERIERVRLAVKTRSDDTAKPSSYIGSWVDPVTGLESTREEIWAIRTTITIQSLSWDTTDPSTQPWTQDVIDRIEPRIGSVTHGTGYTYTRFYELYYIVSYDTQPTITGLAMGSLDASRPAFSYVFHDDDGDSQNKYQAKLFTSAQYLAGGFSPDSSTAAWDSGELVAPLFEGGTQNGQIGISLASGGTYRLYVRAARDFVGIDDWWTAWSFTGFSTVAFAPETPTLSVAADDPSARVQLSVQHRINALSAQDSSLENAGAGNWVNAANATVTQSLADAAHGTASLQLASVAGGNMSARLASAGRVACAPGVVMTAIAEYRAAVSARSTRVDIEWYDAGGALLSTDAGVAGNDAAGSYTQRSALTKTAPALTASAGVLLSLHPGSSLTWGLGGQLPAAVAQVEVSDDAGVTWTRPSSLRVAVDQTDQADVLYDYTAPRGASRSYRARSEVYDTDGVTLLVQSAPSSTASAALTLTSSWWFKDLDDPSININPRVTAIDQSITEDADPFRVDGRANPVVIAGTVSGADGTLSVHTKGLAEWDALAAFARLQRAFLIQAPDGQQWMVRLVGDRGIGWRKTRMSNLVRETSFAFVEQDAG